MRLAAIAKNSARMIKRRSRNRDGCLGSHCRRCSCLAWGAGSSSGPRQYPKSPIFAVYLFPASLL
jgi:hypothetical protein